MGKLSMGLGDWRRLTRAAADLARRETHSIRPLASSLAASPPIPSGYHHDMAETNQTDKLPESPTTTRRPRAIVLGAGDREHVRSQAARLTPQIQQHADVLLVDLEFTEELAGVEADFAVVLKDFNIDIPSVVSDKVAKEAKISFGGDLEELKK